MSVSGLLLAAAALYHLADIGMEYQGERVVYQRFEKTAMGEEDTQEAEGKRKKQSAQKETFDYRRVRIDFAALQEKNEDIIGWILFDQNGISYPVLQGEDNEEYLHTLADGTQNPAGSIFMDALCASDFSDWHTILYGHNMKDLSMFGKLKKYRLEEEYYSEHPYFTIYTPQEIRRYLIFAWYEAAEDDDVYQVGFRSDEQFETFVQERMARSLTDTKITAKRTDHVMTLSTCSVKGRRFVVHAKLVDALRAGTEKDAPDGRKADRRKVK